MLVSRNQFLFILLENSLLLEPFAGGGDAERNNAIARIRPTASKPQIFKKNLPTWKIPSYDICNMGFDAVANIRDEKFFFKDLYFWRITLDGTMYNKTKMGRFWHGFPDVKVDAVYSYNTRIRIFSGNRYWSFIGNILEQDSPRPISDFGIQGKKGIDAAFRWNDVEKTYFFRGSEYWAYDEEHQTLKRGYPKSIRLIKGSPRDLDAAFIDPGDATPYFLKGKLAWPLNPKTITAGKPEEIGDKWFDCAKHEESTVAITTTTSRAVETGWVNGGQGLVLLNVKVACICTALLLIYYVNI